MFHRLNLISSHLFDPLDGYIQTICSCSDDKSSLFVSGWTLYGFIVNSFHFITQSMNLFKRNIQLLKVLISTVWTRISKAPSKISVL